jgi:thiaminase
LNLLILIPNTQICTFGRTKKLTDFSRTAGIASLLPSTYEFDYLDSPLESSAALELRDVYPGPYYCFFNQYSSSEMQNAVDFIREVVEEDGPYDAVIGFSQV